MKRFLLVMLVALVAVAAMAQVEPEYRIDPYEGKPGGTLYLGSIGTGPRTFNPFVAQETSSTDITDLMHGTLFSSDNTGMPTIPALATEWWFSEDGRTVYFRVREGLKWSDGHPFTIEDVRWTFEDLRFINEFTRNGNATYKDAEGFLPEVEVDGNVISFTWTEPNVWSFRAIGWGQIMPKHVLDPYVQAGNPIEAWTLADWDKIVGMGPFVIENFIEGVRTVMRKNPHYWVFDEAGNRLPYIDRINYEVVGSQDVMLLKFEAGELDMMGPRAADWPRVVEQAEDKGWVYGVGGPGLGSDFITFNLGHPDPAKRSWFRNPNFRRAIQYMMDKESIIDTLFNGLGTAIYGPVSPSSGFFNPEILEAYPYRYSITRARLELRRGGFDWDAQGRLIDSQGRRVEFDLSTNAGNITRETIAAILVDGASKLGMRVNYAPADFNLLVGKLLGPDYDAVLIGLTGSVDPGSGWNVWRMDGGLHAFNYPPEYNPDVIDPDIYEAFDWEKRIHEIFVRSVGEVDEQARWDLFAEFQMIVAEYQPYVYTITQNYLYVHKDSVHLANPLPNPAAGMLWQVHGIWKD
jgi:peptide/nickel transport system substrate-binding protein